MSDQWKLKQALFLLFVFFPILYSIPYYHAEAGGRKEAEQKHTMGIVHVTFESTFFSGIYSTKASTGATGSSGKGCQWKMDST